MSSSLMPAHLVAQNTTLCSLANAPHVAGVDLVVAAEQAVAVLHEVGRLAAAHRGDADVADERRLDGAVLHGQLVGGRCDVVAVVEPVARARRRR